MYLKGEPFFCEALPKMKYSKVRVNTKEPGSATWWTHLLASFCGKNFAEYISASPDLRDNFQLLNYSDWECFENDTVLYLSTSVIGRHVPLWGSKL